MTKKEVLKKIESIPKKNKAAVLCALVGHSRVVTTYWGYFYCARCEAQIGDSLGGVFSAAPTCAIVGHDCKLCRKNYKEMGWEHKLLSPDPFKEESI